MSPCSGAGRHSRRSVARPAGERRTPEWGAVCIPGSPCSTRGVSPCSCTCEFGGVGWYKHRCGATKSPEGMAWCGATKLLEGLHKYGLATLGGALGGGTACGEATCGVAENERGQVRGVRGQQSGREVVVVAVRMCVPTLGERAGGARGEPPTFGCKHLQDTQGNATPPARGGQPAPHPPSSSPCELPAAVAAAPAAGVECGEPLLVIAAAGSAAAAAGGAAGRVVVGRRRLGSVPAAARAARRVAGLLPRAGVIHDV